MTTAEVAQRLGCSPAHVARLVKDGKLRGRLLTRRLYLVDRASVEEYAAQPVTVGWKRGRPRGQRASNSASIPPETDAARPTGGQSLPEEGDASGHQ